MIEGQGLVLNSDLLKPAASLRFFILTVYGRISVFLSFVCLQIGFCQKVIKHSPQSPRFRGF